MAARSTTEVTEHKNQRFLHCNAPGVEDTFIISDYLWASMHEKELREWLIEHQIHCTFEGMVIHIPDPKERMLFLLKWQN